MRATIWNGKKDIKIETVDDPRIEAKGDAIVRVTLGAICGSDLHLYNGLNPTMKHGDVLGHEFCGEVVEVGSGVKKLSKGDRVVVSFAISCGSCHFCERELYSACETTNPNHEMAAEAYGTSGAGLFGFSHLFGGFPGGQAEFVRVPHADVGCQVVPQGLADEKILFLGDILSTGWMAAENCQLKGGETVAVWGAGPVGQMTLLALKEMGAGQLISIDCVPERLALSARQHGARTINFEKVDVNEALLEWTSGRGPEACVDAVGMEAHATGLIDAYDKTKQALRLETDRPHALRQAIQACRKGGTVSIPGVYAGFMDKVNFGSAFAKGLTFKMGQTHVQRLMPPLLKRISNGLDPSFVISHRVPLDGVPDAYEMFNDKRDSCTKVVFKP